MYGTAGFLPPPVFQKPYFQILFFPKKKVKKGNHACVRSSVGTLCVRSSVGTELGNLALCPGFDSGRKFSIFCFCKNK